MADMIPAMLANRDHIFAKPLTHQSGMQNEVTILVVSANLEGRRTVNKILEELSMQVISCWTLSQAEEVLSRRRPNLIFCDERLPDGSYSDLSQLNCSGTVPPPVVVLTRTGEWDLYIEATRRGAFDVIRSPWCPTDFELCVIRAVREEKYNISKTTRRT
jgi:DNA-binding NtrC family response regulator